MFINGIGTECWGPSFVVEWVRSLLLLPRVLGNEPRLRWFRNHTLVGVCMRSRVTASRRANRSYCKLSCMVCSDMTGGCLCRQHIALKELIPTSRMANNADSNSKVRAVGVIPKELHADNLTVELRHGSESQSWVLPRAELNIFSLHKKVQVYRFCTNRDSLQVPLRNFIF